MTVLTEKLAAAAANQPRLTERMRGLLNLLNLHFAGVALLVLVNVYLLIQAAIAWNVAKSQNAEALAQQTVVMKTAEIAAKPLQGLDGKLKASTVEADRFYERRLPFAYSEVVGELGVLAKKQGVKLTRGQYAEASVLTGGLGALTEVQMDYGLSGDYRPLVLFVNALERDKMFFLINGVTLTGQQSGTVGLRLHLTTYLRPPKGDESSQKVVVGPNGDAAVDAADGATTGGGNPR
jgi:type IV pilus assembly protein PilO